MAVPRLGAGRGGRAVRRASASAVPVAVALVLAGCGGAHVPVATSRESVRTVADVPYTVADGVTLRLDACVPVEPAESVPAVVLIHGGGFVSGDRQSDGMRALCEELAESGAAAFSVDYRLAPDYVFPSQVQDVQAAIEWLREPAQVDRFGIDPGRIAVLGSSAGAILAQSVGTAGEGPVDSGSRVAAVVSLSGVSLMTEEALTLGEPSAEAAALVLTYLGCEEATTAACPQAGDASPLVHVDPSDPPALLVTGSEELVPADQARAMADALANAGVGVDVIVEDGDAHGLALLTPATRERVVAFLVTELGA